jgi:hypothetical protein
METNMNLFIFYFFHQGAVESAVYALEIFEIATYA